ncbi:lytic transglycosylase domain-containing protein [Pantoea sp. SS70]|uniref:lytic transglycosylase domain-containing protein n=1 Tax=Pantoea sp. SS70 TaxID=3024247 RepID=UPI002452AF9D|nr:lytic transglycosylase domain-containing protein [Pantoea sp. SS70]WGK60010.1 lytic transglycosylase domain-containing protein [Pantoea sp. SS70]
MLTIHFWRTLLLLAAALFFSVSAQAYCFREAGARYHVSPQLLRAIAQVESGMNPHAVGYNRDKQGRVISRDFGLMQINSTHLAKLKAMGVISDERDLLTQPCLNVQTGAWILAQHLQVCGLTWQCLGSYNAGFADGNQARRMLYARKVYSIWLASR